MNPADKLLCAIISLIVPGIGQLIQGRTQTGLIFLVCAVLLWGSIVGILLTPIVHIWACINAYSWDGKL